MVLRRFLTWLWDLGGRTLSVRDFEAKPLELAQNPREDWPACHTGPPIPSLLLFSPAHPSLLPQAQPCAQPCAQPPPMPGPWPSFWQRWPLLSKPFPALLSAAAECSQGTESTRRVHPRRWGRPWHPRPRPRDPSQAAEARAQATPLLPRHPPAVSDKRKRSWPAVLSDGQAD